MKNFISITNLFETPFYIFFEGKIQECKIVKELIRTSECFHYQAQTEKKFPFTVFLFITYYGEIRFYGKNNYLYLSKQECIDKTKEQILDRICFNEAIINNASLEEDTERIKQEVQVLKQQLLELN